MSKFIIPLLFLMLPGSLYAQEIKINAQVRYRGENAKNRNSFDQATFGKNLSWNDFGMLRSRFGITLTGTDNVSAFFQLQDARRFGEETNTLTDADADQFDLHQGYILVGDFLIEGMSLKVGRMEIALGNERLVGPVGWSNTGRSFDGGLLNKRGEAFSFSLFGTRINEMTPTLHFDPDEDFYGFYGSYTHSEGRTFNGFTFLNVNNDRFTSGPANDDIKLLRFTAGFDYTASIAEFNYEAEAAVQFGKQARNVDFPRDDIRAYMFGVRLRYQIEHARKPYVGAGFDFLSGDDESADDTFRTFNTLFATNHKYYGYMDYFVNVPAATSNLGLRDFIVSGGSTINEKITLSGDWHYFLTHKENNTGNSYLGNELDLTLQYNYRQDLGIRAGFSFFIPGDIPKEAPDNDHSGLWPYVMLTYNFSN